MFLFAGETLLSVSTAANNADSDLASRKFSRISTSLPMGSSEIGAFSIFASMVRLPTAAAPSTTSFVLQPSTVWTNMHPK